MRHILVCHPETPSTAVSAIAVDLAREGGDLVLQYAVTGAAGRLTPAYPSPAKRHRADALWLHTCFEAFVKPAGAETYWEFNLAPSWDWQAYVLSGYRAGRRPEAAIVTPTVGSRYAGGELRLSARWPVAGVIPDGPWQVGLAAVIDDGAISYWALRHAPDKPDFHHPDAFALTVTP